MSGSRVVIVAQAFKETLTPVQVAAAVERAVRDAGLEPVVVYGSDGGDGLLEALGARLVRRTVHRVEDPLLRPVALEVGWLDERTAVVESRLACGLSLLAAGERDPLRTSSRGVGTLIKAVADLGAAAVYVGLGGSATVDGGLGLARAWGWTPVDESGAPLPEGGGALPSLARLEPGKRPGPRLTALADVRNPLTGPRGARVYAAQKGAPPAGVELLAAGLERLAAVAAAAGRGELADLPGAGAAGGLGFGLAFFGEAEIVSGAGWVLEQAGLGGLLEEAALVVVGEGAFDRTSLEGKLTGEVIARAAAARVPVLLLAPRVSEVPAGVVVESGGGVWSSDDLARRASRGLARVVRLLGQ